MLCTAIFEASENVIRLSIKYSLLEQSNKYSTVSDVRGAVYSITPVLLLVLIFLLLWDFNLLFRLCTCTVHFQLMEVCLENEMAHFKGQNVFKM